MNEKKLKRVRKYFSMKTVKGQLLYAFFLVIFLMSIISFYTFINARNFLSKMDAMFINIVKTNELKENFSETDESLYKYLNTNNTDDLFKFISESGKLKEKMEKISKTPSRDTTKLVWKNIGNMMEKYLEKADRAVYFKKARRVENYYKRYQEAEEILNYIYIEIEWLNTGYIEQNTKIYVDIKDSLKGLQLINFIIIIAVIIISIIIVFWSASVISKPIKKLSEKALEISKGKFDVPDVVVDTEDELKELANTFNKMKNSIVLYIDEIKEKSKIEVKLAEQEMQNIKMKSLVKHARLETLQSQINPHFLFNTLNACIQVANMEEADRTVEFLFNLSKLFRYNLKNINHMVALSEEIDNIKAYVYLLSIRFSDILKFSWDINSEKLDVKVPLLILQPLVENSFFHGISKKENGGEIMVSVNEDGENVVVIVKDNGIGMTNEKMESIFRKSREEEYEAEEENQDKQYTGNGIGMSNVIKRLRLFYDKEVFFIKSTVGEGTEFIIKIPAY